MAASQKFRNVRRNGRATLVVDDIASASPWRVRFPEIRGTARAIPAPGGSAGPGDLLAVRFRAEAVDAAATVLAGGEPCGSAALMPTTIRSGR